MQVLEFDSMEAFNSSDFGNDTDASKWVAAGKPKMFVKVASVSLVDGLYTGHVDAAYGKLDLRRNGESVATGAHCAISDKVVFIDKDYFGATKYLWT